MQSGRRSRWGSTGRLRASCVCCWDAGLCFIVARCIYRIISCALQQIDELANIGRQGEKGQIYINHEKKRSGNDKMRSQGSKVWF